MFTFYENNNIHGHLTISKLYPTGNEDVVFDDHNIIVSGMGFGLAYLFSLLGSQTITDYQIDRFQLGVSGSTAAEVSSTFQLSSPLSSISEYVGNSGDLYVFSAIQLKNGVNVTSPTPYFSKIPFSKVTRINESSVRYTIVVDQESCNNLTRLGQSAPLNEIGLFMKNPKGVSPEASVLVAYRKFSNIIKTSDFALVFRWTISFS